MALKRAILGLVFAMPLSAHAQHIDQYLDPDVPGFGSEPGVTVASRLHPEYDYQGVRAGSFVIRPEVMQSAGYEDNILGMRTGQGGAVVETQGTLAADSDWGRNSIGGKLMVDSNAYPGHGRQSFTNWNAQLGGTYEIGRDTFYAGFTHLNMNQTQRDLDVPQLESPIPYRVEDGRIDYRAQFSRLAVDPGVDLSIYRFDNGVVDGIPYLQGYRDRTVVQPHLTATYELSPLRSLVAVFNDADAAYNSAPIGQPRRDFNDISFLGGINYDTGAPIRLRLLAGYETRHFSAVQYRAISAPIVEGSAIWTPTELTTVTTSVARYIEDSASEVTSGYTETALKLAVDHEYLRSVVLHADGGYYLDSYPHSSAHQTFVAIDSSVTWLLNRHVRLVARYDFSTRRSPTSTQDASTPDVASGDSRVLQDTVLGGSYTDNRFVLQIKFGL